MSLDKAIKVRFTEKELERLNQSVMKTTFSREGYIRNLLNGYEPQARAPDGYYDTVNELRELTVKLLRLEEMGMFSGYGEAVTPVLDGLKETCDALQNIINPRSAR